MSTYTFMPQLDQRRFAVSIAGADGINHTTIGFANEAAARAWVARAERMAKIWKPSSRFGKSRVM